MTTNIMKKLAGTFALAAAALAAPLAARADGDIIAIFPVDDTGASIAAPVSTPDAPLQSGDDIRFAVRLTKRTGPTDTAWSLVHVGIGSTALDDLVSPFALGLYVAGDDVPRYAAYDGRSEATGYTDVFFRYRVRPGDFALPAILAVNQDSPCPANKAQYGDLSFHVSPQGLACWAIQSQDASGTTYTANLLFKTSGSLTNQDYDLRTAGFYVKTVDFDEATATSLGAWRSVPAGTTAQGTIHVESAPTNTMTLYVWSTNESVVAVNGSLTRQIHVTADTTEARSVAVIKVVAGQQDYNFRFTGGAAAAGSTATLVLSACDDFNYQYVSNERYEDYLTATVAVTEAPDPYISLTDATGKSSAKVVATSNVTDYTEMRLVFSKAFTEDVTVTLKQKIDDVEVESADNYVDNRYLAILTDPEANPIATPSVQTLTMPKGETELKFYLFGLGATDKLASPGLTLVPDVSDQSSDIQSFFAAGDHKAVLVKVTDQAPTVEVSAPSSAYCNEKVSIGVTVADNWRDLQTGEGNWNEAGYKVAVSFDGTSALETNGVAFTEDGTVSLSVKVPVEGNPVTGLVKVWDPTHTKASEATFSMNVQAARAAEPKFFTDSNQTNAYGSAYLFQEGDTPWFGVTLTSPAPQEMYAFLVPLDENASNLVSCAACTNGLSISAGASTSAVARVTFLDGFGADAPMRAKFAVDLRDKQDYAAEDGKSYDSTYVMRTATLSCVNVSPTITSVQLNSSTVANNGLLKAKVPSGANARFIAKISDPSAKDLEATGDDVIVTKWVFTDGDSESVLFATNVNGSASCTYRFASEDTTETVTVYALDKDDLKERADRDDLVNLDWGEAKFAFTVNVASQPAVLFCKSSKDATEIGDEGYSFDETCAEGRNYLYVRLTDRPDGGDPAIDSANPLLVNLEWKRSGSRGYLELVTNQVAFVNATSDTKGTPVAIDLPSLNGAGESGTLYFVTAKVITSNSSNQYGQAWCDYYGESTAAVYVNNVAPTIVEATRADGVWIEAGSGTNTCAAGEIFTIDWRVTDIVPDLTNGKFSVSWSGVNATASSPTTINQLIPVNLAGYEAEEEDRVTAITNRFVFAAPTSAGAYTVTMTVNDGDGGIVTKEWIIDVAASKNLIVNVYGPAESAQSKYKAATGIGQGFVAAKGNPSTGIASFVRTFSYAESMSSAEIYAWAYPSKETWDARWQTAHSEVVGKYVDNGKIPGLISSSFASLGNPLDPYGGLWTSGDYYDFSTMGWLEDETAGDYDSYFYRWVITKAAKNDKGTSGSSTGGSTQTTANDAAPTLDPLTATRKIFDLDSGTENGNYGDVEVEAVFSRELYPLDNLGDINADGIPDKIVELYGLGATKAGEIPEDDIPSLADLNDDEDFLPVSSTAASYSTLIPGLPSSWGEAQAFTAKLEVRGYGEGLNDGAQLAGLKKHKLHPDYNSDDVEARKAARDYSDLEMAAWSLVDYDTKWSPERPSDPTKADTDGDGFPDGYEYYFWYRAHVGDPDYFRQTGIVRKLTGRRYDPKNPGDGTVITSEEIEKIMDPMVAYAGDPKTIDTDNDGLPDLLEILIGTNPFDFDTDGDGLPDGWEVMIANLDPLVTQSYAGELSDTLLNADGDAMAISSYKLEKTQNPVPANYEHAKRLTFAVLDANGDTAGVQWYAMPTTAGGVSLTAGTEQSGYQLVASVDGAAATFFSATEPSLTDDGLLKVDLDVNTLVTYEGGNAIGYPYTLRAGEKVTKGEETVTATAYTVTEEVAASKANACWIYGKGAARTRIGEVAETAAEYGCLALARQKAVPAGATVVAFPSEDRDVAFLHYLCYQEFGFDPRTAWSSENPLHKRWGKVTNGEAEEDIYVVARGGYTGTPARTRDYATYDEFLVSSFFRNNTTEGDTLVYEATGLDDKAPTLAKEWYALTTNPQGPMDNIATTTTNFWGRASTNGADTDGDGVPDGWELYVMAGPKTKGGAYVFAPPYAGFSTAAMIGDDTGIGATIGDGASEAEKMTKSYFSPFIDSAKKNDTSNQIWVGGQDNSDGLNQFQEFEGTDTMLYYAAYSDTIVHPADTEWKWLNKFFPTDPWSPDTDGDGVKDGDEKAAFAYVTTTYDDEAHGTLRVIPGGGLNPCSVDTDNDGLPDGWEKQFAGQTVSPTNEADGYIDGMDGTVSDAYTTPGGPNRDYDHDGLENWQEYLTGTMRCWRYDDPISPTTYWPSEMYGTYDEDLGYFKLDAAVAAKNFHEAGYLDAEDEGEFWYKTLLDASSPIYNPHLVMDRAPNAQYFSRVTNVWDSAYLDADLAGSKNPTAAYYWFYDRIDGTKLKDLWPAAWEKAGFADAAAYEVVPKKYASCSPIKADSDGDGMDDYYEVFHGMNPLLGVVGSPINAGASDIVYDALSNGGAKTAPAAWSVVGLPDNYWVRTVASAGYTGKKPRGTGYDFEVFPWLNGLPDADPDGDGIRNQEEAIMPLVGASAAWHHTDPTPLWMTDSSYTNSLVSMNYRLAHRGEPILLTSADSFSYGGKTYALTELDDFEQETALGVTVTYVRPYSVDAWKVVGTLRNADGWMASFEENEGFDTDHDGLMDQDEVAGKFRGQTDPLDADSPRRRQAMYFQGPNRPSILQTMPFEPEIHPDAQQHAGQYPDDLAFLEFTVECWVKAESLDDATVIERAVLVSQSNPDDQEYIRRNFRLGLSGGKWVGSFDPNDTTTASVEVFSDNAATTAWTHLALTYDLNRLTLYVNGTVAGYASSGLQPAYGRRYVATGQTGNVLTEAPAYQNHAFVVGASVKTFQSTDAASRRSVGRALDVTNGVGWDAYEKFFTGYVDEIRVWDGARSATEIANARMSRFTSEDALANRAEFYETWKSVGENGDLYRGRYAKDASGNGYVLPAELRFHWAFDSLFGAASEGAVAKAPAGFNVGGLTDDEDGARARRSRPSGYGIAWWQTVLAGYTGTVYGDPAWICWVPNTVAHLPRYDGTTLDSFYWSEDFKGDQSGAFKFARTAEPVSRWKQLVYGYVKAYEDAFYAPGSRYHYMTTNDVATGSNFRTLYEFTGRHLNQSGDDMLALGGAFAKHVDAMWDDQGPSANWEVSGTDEDGNGLPDWWEKWANGHYLIDTEATSLSWTTLVRWPDQNGTVMTAGEAYLRDLARGFHGDKDGDPVEPASDGDYAQKADLDGNGIPDWWEELYGISGEAALADHDNDGLPNYVEYLLSEVFRFKGITFDPTRADSVQKGIPDYFYKVGELYVGEIFTDHDLVDDAWEDAYGTDYASRRVYDPYEDADGDGWSNRSENRYSKQSMPIVANEQSHYAATDGLVADYPIPTVELTVHYAGPQNAAVEKAPLVVQMTTSQTLERSMDATFSIDGAESSAAGTGTSSSASSTKDADGTAYTRSIGKWSNRHAIGTLTPGYVNKNSLLLEYCYDPSMETYNWVVYSTLDRTYYTTKRGTRADYDSDKRKYGDANVELLSRGTDYATFADVELRVDETGQNAVWYLPKSGKTFGTINLTSGAFDLDLSAFKGQYVVNASNDSERVSLEDQYFRIAYSANTAVGLPRKLYLGQATEGHVREGLNTIVAFADLDGDGAYTAGEPYGCVAGVDVSWKGTAVDLTLTETTPMMNRVDPVKGLDDRTAVWGTESGNYTNFTTKAEASGGDYNRIRLVRDIIVGTKGSVFTDTIGARRVILDMVVHGDVNPWITEANILASGAFDLDWDYLYDEVVSKINANGQIKSSTSSVLYLLGEVKSVVYGIVLGNGDIDDTTQAINYAKVMPQRTFDVPRQLPVPVSVGSGGVVSIGRPTFKWKMANDVNGYTAFKLKIANKSGTSFSWTSDYQRMPAADENGVYTWSAPVFADDTPAGATGTFANNQTYTWSISAYNAKFKQDSFVAGGDFYLGVQTNGYDTGTARVSVRYYGPSVVTNKFVTRVYAYESPDFTGTPVAGGLVTAEDDDGVNCRLIGIPKGSYYLQAFVDMNNNGVCDKWESMGYLCTRDGTTADYLDPVAVTFDTKVGTSDLAVIYMEDADTDRDNLPDAWEYAMATATQRANGTFLDAKGVSTLTTLDGAEIPVNKTLTGDLLDEINKTAVIASGLAGDVKSALSSSASFASLVMGVTEARSVTYDAATGVLSVNPTVEDGTFAITGVALDAAEGVVRLTLAGDVVAAEDVTSSIYTVKVGSTLTVKVYRSETLAESPTLVATKTVVVKGDTLDGSVITVPFDVSATSGFYRVEVE